MSEEIENIRNKTQASIDKALTGTFLAALAKIVSNSIKLRTRLGKGLDGEGGTLSPLKKLSSRYKAQRERFKKSGDLDNTTTPSKSNLTKTGQLLRSIFGRVKGKTVEIYIKDDRNDGVSNNDIVKWQAEDQDRPFFYISKNERRQIQRLVRKKILQNLKSRR